MDHLREERWLSGDFYRATHGGKADMTRFLKRHFIDKYIFEEVTAHIMVMKIVISIN